MWEKGTRGRWTAEEVERLTEAVKKYGEGDWDAVQRNSGIDRSINACRGRWIYHVKPDWIKGKFTKVEKDKMMHLNHIMGNKWTEIASEFPGRSADDVETCCKVLKTQMNQPWITKQLVDDSQAAHNPDTTGKTSVFGQGSGPFHQFPDPFMDGKSSSMFAQGLVSSQFSDPNSKFEQGLGSSEFLDPNSTFTQGSTFAQGLFSSQFSDPNSKFEQGLGSSEFLDPNSTFAQGLVSSQFTDPNYKFEQGLGSSEFLDPNSTFVQGLVSSQFSDPNSKFEQGLGSSEFLDPNSAFAQGLVSSQFSDPNNKFEQDLGSSEFLDPNSMFAQGLVSSQFSDPNNKFEQGLGSSKFLDPYSMFAQGSGYSQFPAVFPSLVMQQHNNLESTFSSIPAADQALIDRYTGLSGNTSMNTGLHSLTRFQHHNDYLQSMFYTARTSDGIPEEDLDRAMNPLNEVVELFIKKQKKDK